MDGTDTINNVPCYKLKLTSTEAGTQECYFDSKTYYLVRMDVKVEMAGEQQETTVNFSNFKKLPEGITVAMTLETAQGNFNYSSIEINKPISESIFKPSSK
jgi:outer membrane lipoprotein-sorting protein